MFPVGGELLPLLTYHHVIQDTMRDTKKLPDRNTIWYFAERLAKTGKDMIAVQLYHGSDSCKEDRHKVWNHT